MLTAKVRLYLSGTTNEHKCALTEGSASQYPSGLKIPRMTLKQTSFRGLPKGTQVSPILLPYFFGNNIVVAPSRIYACSAPVGGYTCLTAGERSEPAD